MYIPPPAAVAVLAAKRQCATVGALDMLSIPAPVPWGDPSPLARPPVTVNPSSTALSLPVTVSDDLQPGVVTMPFGWWNGSFDQDRSVNVLTNPNVAADDLGSSHFHENLVEVLPST